ncbi:MAG: alpha/beta hydrolase family protein [Planctomycetes bacterium]|nr:alpha/beta hydrolase family protein [Planctomycetota bacterium]
MDRRNFLASLPVLSTRTATAAGEPGPTAMPADPARELPATGADLGTLFADVEKLAAANPFAFRFPSDRFKTHAEYRTSAREKVFEVLSYKPPKVEPKAEVLERTDRGDHIRERVLFSTTPWFRVPAYVLIPKGLKAPAPAIVDLHSHGGMFLFGKEKVTDLGTNHAAMTEYHKVNYDGRPTATELVRRGYVVISIDAFMFGERRVMIDADRAAGWDRSKYALDDVRRLNQVCRGKESTIVKGLTLAGATWPGVVFWDDIRTVDYLASRPEVDPKKIGCVGISMGGYRAAYLTALDERIAAGCVVGFMSSVRPMMKSHLDTHSFVHFLPGLHAHLDLPDVSALAAPRALMVQQCKQDRLFPLAGMEESLTKIEAAFKAAGVEKQFVGRFHDEPHRFTRTMQDEAFDWFDAKLKS